MSWANGYDEKWNRDIGYGVPAFCDHPACNEKIDRGLSYVCGGQPYGGEDGCGLFFCLNHMAIGEETMQQCERCGQQKPPFEPKPDHPDWVSLQGEFMKKKQIHYILTGQEQ
jgi:hypothetical protein